MSRHSLRFGMFMGPFHATNLDPTYALERDLQLVTLLDRLGFDEAWIGEHHSGGFEIIAAPEVFIAAAAERTKHIRLGTGVKSLPYHHPFVVAETMAQLDHMTRGRVMFGAGPGALPSDSKMFGLAPVDLRPRMDEALDCIVALLRGETVTKKTSWFELCEARLSVGCYSKPTMEIAVASVRSPAGALAAGRHGAGLLVLSGVDDASLKHHMSNWDNLRRNMPSSRPYRRSLALAVCGANSSCGKPRAGAQGCGIWPRKMDRLRQRYRARPQSRRRAVSPIPRAGC